MGELASDTKAQTNLDEIAHQLGSASIKVVGNSLLGLGECQSLMAVLIERYPDGLFDMVFADPPYFLSNGGITCQAGRMVKVDKGNWDKSGGADVNHRFNYGWISLCQKLLKKNGTLWVSGTHHVIHSVGFAMQQLGMKILNDVTWEKPNPPPNLSCRYFTHSTETLLWAAKTEKSKHCFNYELMKQANSGKQMKSVWRMGAPNKQEKTFGKHPTQKPIELLERCILSSTNENQLILDPFMGSGTTLLAAARNGRMGVGFEQETDYFDLAVLRLEQESRTPSLFG